MAMTKHILAVALALGSTVSAQDSCTACHPGALRGLAQTPHAALPAQRPTDSCIVCHAGSDAHQLSAKANGLDGKQPISKPPAVTDGSCAACHADKGYRAEQGMHAFVRKVVRVAQLPGTERGQETAPTPTSRPAAKAESQPIPLQKNELFGLSWSGLAVLGYRFVDIDGARGRYDSDVRLNRGFRLSELEVSGERGEQRGALDRLRVSAEDIGDPWQRVRAEVDRKDFVRGKAEWTKSRYAYRASGEFHRVDSRSDDLGFDLSVPLRKELELFGSFERSIKDGFWLTERVGNRNLAPVGSVAGVASPREIDANDLAVGARGNVDGLGYSAAFEFHDEDSRDRWTFARTSPIDPAYPESESFLSHTTLRGPGVRTTLTKKLERFHASLAARWLSRDKRVSGDGFVEGYDISQFTTTTTASASGEAETWLADANVGYDLSDTLTLDLDLRWRDHKEQLSIDQYDETNYPLLGTTTVRTLSDPRTSQRVLEGTAALDWQPAKQIGLSAGYGFSRESLHVPDLEAGDPDFERGTIRSDGFLLGARWKPVRELLFDLKARTFGMGGSQLHELTQDEQRSLAAKVRWSSESVRAETFWKTTQVKNDIVQYLNDSTTFGISGGLSLGEAFEIDAGWVYADLNSRVLTNFYFDPDPNPVPTFVGFKGDTHTLTTGATWHPGRRLEARVDAAYTTTNGTFDLDTYDWRVDLRYEVLAGGQVGALFRQLDYTEIGRADDYDAKILMLYWRQVIGRAR